MQEKYGEQGLAVVGVTKASAEDTRKFQVQLGATYPILADGGANFESFGVTMIPETFLLAGDGTVLAQGMDEVDAELEKHFAQ